MANEKHKKIIAQCIHKTKAYFVSNSLCTALEMSSYSYGRKLQFDFHKTEAVIISVEPLKHSLEQRQSHREFKGVKEAERDTEKQGGRESLKEEAILRRLRNSLKI